MGKNIVLFIDGTGNKGNPQSSQEALKDSNVCRLRRAVLEDDKQQAAHYLQGVGTRLGNYTLGSLSGFGTAKRIRAAYSFLSKHYTPGNGDRIFLFGFSRGAFAARSLAGFVDQVGLLYKEHLHLVPEAYWAYVNEGRLPSYLLEKVLHKISPAHTPKSEGRNMPIHFLGVWDTVGALGFEPLEDRFIVQKFISHHKTDLPSYITHARHALALHDLRAPFEPLFFTSYGPGQSLKQTWFPGAHSDVGGGLKKHQIHARIALDWMVEEACDNGLIIKEKWRAQDFLQGVSERFNNSNEGMSRPLPFVVRECLKNQNQHNDQTLKSFRFHPNVGLRLVEPQSYTEFPDKARGLLSEVDQLTLNLLLRCRFHPHPVPFSATVEEAQQSRSVIKTFVETFGQPSKLEMEKFTKALCLSILCGDCVFYHEFVQRVEATFRLSAENKNDVQQLEACVNRLHAIVRGINQCGLILVPQWSDPLKNLSKSLEQRHQQLFDAWGKASTFLQKAMRAPKVLRLKSVE